MPHRFSLLSSTYKLNRMRAAGKLARPQPRKQGFLVAEWANIAREAGALTIGTLVLAGRASVCPYVYWPRH
jgi:hypothetical protein